MLELPSHRPGNASECCSGFHLTTLLYKAFFEHSSCPGEGEPQPQAGQVEHPSLPLAGELESSPHLRHRANTANLFQRRNCRDEKSHGLGFTTDRYTIDRKPKQPSLIALVTMSSEARSISAADFSRAIEDLPMENIYSKASEIANSISHLERSNKQLQEYSDSIRNDTSIEGSTREEGDKECLEAIRENDVVIQRQRDRVRLLRAEVERRGGRWHEGDFGGKTNGTANGTSEQSSGGTLTDEELRRQMQGRMGDEDDDGEPGMHL